jgi:hypothetical protein
MSWRTEAGGATRGLRACTKTLWGGGAFAGQCARGMGAAVCAARVAPLLLWGRRDVVVSLPCGVEDAGGSGDRAAKSLVLWRSESVKRGGGVEVREVSRGGGVEGLQGRRSAGSQ